MTVWPAGLEPALHGISLDSSASFRWFGTRVGHLPARVARALTAQTRRGYLARQLQDCLYRNFYCPGVARPDEAVAVQHQPPEMSPYVQALCAANSGAGSLERGWQVHALDGDRIVVERAGLRLWVGPGDVVANAGQDVRLGGTCAVRLPKELLKLSPGFYLALGDNGLSPGPDAKLLRFYWNVRHQGAPRLVATLTKSLNDAGLAFRLKVLDEPGRFGRCDAGVLYVRQCDFAQVAAPVRACYAEIADALSPGTPAFTKALAPGLALAEEPPGSAESFGMHRCRLVAEAVLQAAEGPGESVQRRLEAVAARFDGDGLRLAEPFLNPGSTDAYDLDVTASR